MLACAAVHAFILITAIMHGIPVKATFVYLSTAVLAALWTDFALSFHGINKAEIIGESKSTYIYAIYSSNM